MRTPVRVLCADDHAFLVEGLKSRFDLDPAIEFVGRLPTADHLVDEVNNANADVVLLDIEMPGQDPFEALRDVCRVCPEVRVLMLSAYVRDHYIDQAVSGGAWGYLCKGDDPESVIRAIKDVANGQFAFSPTVQDRCQIETKGGRAGGRPRVVRPTSRLDSLTTREMEILRLIGKGMTRAEIAASIFRSPKTVDAHRISIMDKLDIHDRVELARFAIREGLVEP